MNRNLIRRLIEDVIEDWYNYGEIDLVGISMLEIAVIELKEVNIK